MGGRQRKRSESAEKVAREYIDKVVAINRRYGMGGRVPKDTYDRAVEEAARLFRGSRSS
jgi:hypothetical protein